MANETQEPKQQHTTIILLIAILLAAGAVAAVIFFIPGTDTIIPFEQRDGSTNTVGAQGFDTGVLQGQDYTTLDLNLLNRGLLPVQPPAGAGKTNIFR